MKQNRKSDGIEEQPKYQIKETLELINEVADT